MTAGSAGTAADGYRVAPQPCATYRADPRNDYGRRPFCVCGREFSEHRPTPKQVAA